MNAALVARRDRALTELYAALRRADVPGTRLDLYDDPAVYTSHTCTRIRGRYFLTQRTLHRGAVLETGSVPTQYTAAAVDLILGMAPTGRAA